MIDVDHQVNATTRTVGSRTLAAGEARTVTVSQVFATDAEDLWNAVTTDRISRWFLPITGDLRVGGSYQLEGNAGGTVQTCVPPTEFSATWEYAGDVSWIEVRVVPETGDTARLVLEHIAHVDDERWTEFGPGAVGIGWDMGLLGLSLHLKTGEAANTAEIMEWMATAEGRSLIAKSSDAWFAAHVAAGGDPVTARGSADRTTAAYTGEPTE